MYPLVVILARHLGSLAPPQYNQRQVLSPLRSVAQPCDVRPRFAWTNGAAILPQDSKNIATPSKELNSPRTLGIQSPWRLRKYVYRSYTLMEIAFLP